MRYGSRRTIRMHRSSGAQLICTSDCDVGELSGRRVCTITIFAQLVVSVSRVRARTFAPKSFNLRYSILIVHTHTQTHACSPPVRNFMTTRRMQSPITAVLFTCFGDPHRPTLVWHFLHDTTIPLSTHGHTHTTLIYHCLPPTGCLVFVLEFQRSQKIAACASANKSVSG